MDNKQFLDTLKQSFVVYLKTSARSPEKLKVLHSAISKDIFERLGDESYSVSSLGYGDGKEMKISGRYMDKAVDITISKNHKKIAGIAVKYVMSNYSQNSNNYFENMLGETANLRSAKIPYFQIFVIPDHIPYFEKDGRITKWEEISDHNIKKYVNLSNDNIDMFMHTPNKTLFFITHISGNTKNIRTKKEFEDYYLKNDFDVTISNKPCDFGNGIVYNDYDTFAQKVMYAIKSL